MILVLISKNIIACFQSSPSVTKKKHVHISIVKLVNAYRTFNVIANKIKGRGSLEYIKELCEYLYVLPSKPKTTEIVSTPITSHGYTSIKLLIVK